MNKIKFLLPGALLVLMAFSVVPVYADDTDENRGFWNTMTGFFGKSQEELQMLFKDKRPHEVAEEQGFSHEDLHNAVMESKKERLQSRVEEGRITQERADEILNKIQERHEMVLSGESVPGEHCGKAFETGFGKGFRMGKHFGD